jgi:hypothetical protein
MSDINRLSFFLNESCKRGFHINAASREINQNDNDLVHPGNRQVFVSVR